MVVDLVLHTATVAAPHGADVAPPSTNHACHPPLTPRAAPPRAP